MNAKSPTWCSSITTRFILNSSHLPFSPRWLTPLVESRAKLWQVRQQPKQPKSGIREWTPLQPLSVEWSGPPHLLCQGSSHGGSYMDKGMSYIRIGLFPVVVPGDYLALPPTLCLPHWSLTHVWCQMIQGCISMLPPFFPFHVCAPEGYVSWSLVCPLAS